MRRDGRPVISAYDPDKIESRQTAIINGLLRRGEVMIISSPTKAGKSWLVLELAIAVVTGQSWLGLSCRRGRALCVDGELDVGDLDNRIHDVAAALGAPRDFGGRLLRWPLMGYAEDISSLADEIIDGARTHQCDLIVIDPAYVFMDGEENSAGDMRRFCNQLGTIARAADCALVFVHHYSKGYKGDVESLDRMAGSGVLARYPSTVMDIIRLAPSEEVPDGVDVYRVETTARSFPPLLPFEVTVDWRGPVPLHERAADGQYADLKPGPARARRGVARNAQEQHGEEEHVAELEAVIDRLMSDYPEGRIPRYKVMQAAGITDSRTLKSRLSHIARYTCTCPGRGKMSYVEQAVGAVE